MCYFKKIERRVKLRLNVVGNGFDLYHGLPSSYYYFGCYLISTKPEFYKEIVKMYNLDGIKMLGHPGDDYTYVVEDVFWREFEKHLGDVDEDYVVGTHIDDLDLENDDPVEIEMNEHLVAHELKKSFVHWVKDTLDKEENYKLIKDYINIVENKIDINDEEYYLVFNYTHTLQKIYNVSDEKIHYVHGECLIDDDYGDYDDADDLIVGHGNDARIKEIEKEIKSLENKYNFTQGMKNEIGEYNCILRILKDLKKDVEGCEVWCKYFYDRIHKNIDTIRVLGMSLGEVDIPYLQQLKNKWPSAKWEFSYYGQKDIDKISEVVEKDLDLDSCQYSLFEFVNEKSSEMLHEIISLQGITEYEKVNRE